MCILSCVEKFHNFRVCKILCLDITFTNPLSHNGGRGYTSPDSPPLPNYATHSL